MQREDADSEYADALHYHKPDGRPSRLRPPTANTPYSLSAAYENSFYNVSTGTAWAAEPSLEVNYRAGAKVALTNATVPPYAQWASFSGVVIDQTTVYTLYLDYEAVLPALTYTGVTIYIQARV